MTEIPSIYSQIASIYTTIITRTSDTAINYPDQDIEVRVYPDSACSAAWSATQNDAGPLTRSIEVKQEDGSFIVSVSNSYPGKNRLQVINSVSARIFENDNTNVLVNRPATQGIHMTRRIRTQPTWESDARINSKTDLKTEILKESITFFVGKLIQQDS